jgi:hypothetical protein
MLAITEHEERHIRLNMGTGAVFEEFCNHSYRIPEKLAEIPPTSRHGWHSLRGKFVNDMKADTPMADLCYLGGWKSPLTVMTVYQQADQKTIRNALTNRDQRRAASSR